MGDPRVDNEKRIAEVELERIRRDRDKDLAQVERNRDQDIQKIQNEFKLWATVIPPIPPLLVGLVVWIRRRLREREGVSQIANEVIHRVVVSCQWSVGTTRRN